jgi:hypothetical protein
LLSFSSFHKMLKIRIFRTTVFVSFVWVWNVASLEEYNKVDVSERKYLELPSLLSNGYQGLFPWG